MSYILIAHAASDENGWDGYEGSKPGDQTGKEIRINEYYNGNWNVVLRYKRTDMANAHAIRAMQCANNEMFGYSQPGRKTGIAQLLKDWDPSHCNTPCELDCSAMQSAIARATILSCDVDPKTLTGYEVTATMKKAFLGSGQFEDVTSKVNIVTGAGLKVGDIVVKEGVHTACVVYADFTEIPEPETNYNAYAITRVYVRTSPENKGEKNLCNIELPDGRGIRCFLYENEKCQVVGSNGNWYQIKCDGAKNTWYPWVSKTYIKMVG